MTCTVSPFSTTVRTLEDVVAFSLIFTSPVATYFTSIFVLAEEDEELLAFSFFRQELAM